MKNYVQQNSNISNNYMKEFLDRLFLNRIYPDDQTPGIKKNLSGLSYRLAWLLSQELNFFSPQKLPQIKVMAEKLSTTTASIHDSLAQLEMAGIIIRSTDTSDIHYADENVQFEHAQEFLKYTKKEIASRSFKDYFRLNLFCNMRHEETIIYNIDTLIDSMLSLPNVYQMLESEMNYKDQIYEKLLELKFINENWKGTHSDTKKYIENHIKERIENYTITSLIEKTIKR